LGNSNRNIPPLWRILNRVVGGWRIEVARVRESTSKDSQDFECLIALQWPFIQAFFTYLTFFFMLERAYRLLYHQLDRLNRELASSVVPRELPQRTADIHLLRHIRNKSIAHFASTEPHPDNSAGVMLGVFAHRKEGQLDIESLRFGGMSVVGAKPRESRSLMETHKLCGEYLKLMDSVCDEYYAAVLSHLPKTIDGRKYETPPKGSLWPDPYFEVEML
jgi:hypothetical protein